MSIICIEGHRGGGKSCLATKMATERIASGINVFSASGLSMNFDPLVKLQPENAHKFGSFYLWDKFEQMYNVRGGLIIIDEAYRYMDARRWTEFPDRMKLKLAQNRHETLDKRDTDLLVICQDINQIDVNFRRLCYDVKKISKLPLDFFLIHHYDYSEAKFEELKGKRKGLGYSIFSGKDYYKYYDTKENNDSDYELLDPNWKPFWSPPIQENSKEIDKKRENNAD